MGASVLSKAIWESSHLRPAELRQKTGFHYLVLQVAVCRISTAPLCKSSLQIRDAWLTSWQFWLVFLLQGIMNVGKLKKVLLVFCCLKWYSPLYPLSFLKGLHGSQLQTDVGRT